MSTSRITGLARISGIPRQTLSRWLNNPAHYELTKELKDLLCNGWNLAHEIKNGGQAKIIKADVCIEVLDFAAFEKNKKQARQFLKTSSEIGLTSFIQSKTGWLPEEKKAAPEAHKRLGVLFGNFADGLEYAAECADIREDSGLHFSAR